MLGCLLRLMFMLCSCVAADEAEEGASGVAGTLSRGGRKERWNERQGTYAEICRRKAASLQ